MRTVEDRPAFQRPWVTRFGIPEPRKFTPDIRHWVWTSKSSPDVATLSVPLYPTYPAQLIAVRAMTRTAASTDTTGTLAINGFTVVTFTIPASSRQGYVARPQLRNRWGLGDYLELNISTLGTGSGQLAVILDHIRAEV
jgi:hypothetical protein